MRPAHFAPLVKNHGYFRSNTITFGLSRPAKCTVIVKVFRSAESSISSVSVTLPPALSVITSVRSCTRRIEEEAPRSAFGPSLGYSLPSNFTFFVSCSEGVMKERPSPLE